MKIIDRIKEWFNSQSDTAKTMIVMAIILLILIIIRWNFVVEGVKHGFQFYSK
ncbi:MAG: hypothetical protein IJS02_05525 [Bacteroidales bacterium]|nr:hypothetical protein [Bacteroidales bacterium]